MSKRWGCERLRLARLPFLREVFLWRFSHPSKRFSLCDGFFKLTVCPTRLIRASDHPEAQSIPVIAMTANVFVKDVHDALDAGMNAHIAKPLNLETLKSTLGSCLSKTKQLKKSRAISNNSFGSRGNF